MKQMTKASLAALCTALVAALIAVPVRVVELVKFVEPETGFWSGSSASFYVILGLALVVLVVALITSLKEKKSAVTALPEKKNIPLGIVSLLLTVAFVGDAVTCAVNAINLQATFNPYSMTYAYFMISTGFLATICQAVFAILSALYIMVYAINQFNGKGSYKTIAVLSMNPILWGIARLMVHFVEPIRYLNVSQLTLEILFLIFALVYLFKMVRVASDVGAEGAGWVMGFTGPVAVFLGYVSAFAPFCLLIAGKSSYICESYPMQWVDLALAIFFTATLIVYAPKKNQPVSEPVAEELPEEPDDAVDPDAPSVTAGGRRA